MSLAGCTFVNWAMTGIVDITAVALYMHYWGAFGDIPQWVFALGALAIVGTMNMIGVKWFAEMEFWFCTGKSAGDCDFPGRRYRLPWQR
ncbi:L-asparagine permease [Enterobacter cloacae]|uniref:L-asparagine permease n=1 Tax=Enterobacter cloacae TaxID=550 RepID=A0A377M084_ENTCL|nr:L-asparagine permease [Enterobacter cloacae]